MRKKPVLAWHFVGATLRDGSPIPADGKWLEFKGPLEMCHSGLHASRNPFDALQYAPGATLCLVAVEGIGEEQEQADKLVCSRRKIIARMDATELLRYFARMQALSVSSLWADSDDPKDVVLAWLLTGDDAAWDAALAAARDASWAAARDAAWDAARDAAWDAARDASLAAARDASWDAARDAAWDAAWDAAKNEFTQLVYECFEDFLP